MQNQPNSIRLNKAISDSGYCSRRQADKLIEQGRVAINGKPTALGDRVMPEDQVTVDGEAIIQKSKPIYLVFNKPVGITCTTDTRVKDNIVDYINYPERIFPIGRLDKPSEGLIFLTNDGDIVNKILRAGNKHEKEYIVKVDKPLSSHFIKRMQNGIPILNTITKKCKVEQISRYEFKIILVQGLNRQIRRMCEFLSYRVISLKRTRIMNVALADLNVGTWRHFTQKELLEIEKAVTYSSKTSQASTQQKKRRQDRFGN